MLLLLLLALLPLTPLLLLLQIRLADDFMTDSDSDDE